MTPKLQQIAALPLFFGEKSGVRSAVARLAKNAGRRRRNSTRNFVRIPLAPVREIQQRLRRIPTVSIERYLRPGVTARTTEPIVAPILDDICLPPFAWPWTHDDFGALFKLVQSVAPRLIVELGTAHGNTVANLCRQFPDVSIFTVNALQNQQSGELVTYELSMDEIGRVYKDHGYSDRVTQIYANTLTLDLDLYVSLSNVDVAIVDACHDTGFVVNDFHKVAAFVRPGGLVLMHDTHPSMAGHLRGSYEACVELRKQGFDLRHLRGTWWAIWQA